MTALAISFADLIADRPSGADDATRAARDLRAERVFCLLALALGVLAALYFHSLRDALWEDEIIAITHANQPLPSFFVEILRADIHPPLYFLQLDLWATLFGNTDRTVLANSLFWAAISLIVLFHVARATHGSRAAWFTIGVFALLPAFAWSAGTLRMYALVPALAVAVYFTNRRWLANRRPRDLVLLLIVELMAVSLHAIEFFFVAFILLATLAETLAAPGPRPRVKSFAWSLRWWILAQAVVAIWVLPIAASALVRGSDASAPESALQVFSTMGVLIAGWKASSVDFVRIAGGVIFIALVAAGLLERTTRWRTLVIPLLVLAVAFLVAWFVKPVFKQPVFAANLLPFVALGAGAAAARLRAARWLVGLSVVALALAAFPVARLQRPIEVYDDAARDIRQGVQRGDVVLVPTLSTYWGLLRYGVAVDWGKPLEILPPSADKWASLNAWLARSFGPTMPARLGLVPLRDFVDHDGVRYVIGTSASARAPDAPHVWVLTRDRYASEVFISNAYHPSTSVLPIDFGDELRVRRFDRNVPR